MKKRTAFTLVEMMVIVAVLGILSTFGFASYSRFAQRLEVENAAKELITFIRQVQGYARNGDRGTGDCSVDSVGIEEIAKGNSKFLGWQIKITKTGAQAFPKCKNGSTDGTGSIVSSTPLASGISIKCSASSSECGTNDFLFTKSVFGDTWYGIESLSAGSVATTAQKNKIIVVSDGTFHYRFRLSNGSITNGSFCSPLTNCFSGDRSDSLSAND